VINIERWQINYRLHALATISRKRASEIVSSPAFYVMAAICLLIGSFLVSGFVSTIGSDGINPAKSPLYGLVFNTLKGIFGELFVGRLFADGPFIIAAFVSFLLFSAYLGMSTVMQFGNEKGSGGLELIASGPADQTSIFLGYFTVNAAASASFLIAESIIFMIAALISNLSLSGAYFAFILFLFLGSLILYAYCALASVITRNAFGALACFMAIFLAFIAAQFGMYGTESESGNIIAGSVSYVIQWISPFFPTNFGSESIEYGSFLLFVLACIYPFIISILILGASHVISKRRGVRI
jgi:hypothetical protein